MDSQTVSLNTLLELALQLSMSWIKSMPWIKGRTCREGTLANIRESVTYLRCSQKTQQNNKIPKKKDHNGKCLVTTVLFE